MREDAPSLFLAAYPELLPRLCMNRFYAAEGVAGGAPGVAIHYGGSGAYLY